MLIYVVEQGDTLSSISSEYGVTIEELIQMNGLTWEGELAIGQSLVIPTGGSDPIRTIDIYGYAYPFIDEGVLERTLPDLTYISLFTYGFTYEADLIPIEDEELIRQAWAQNTAPLMVIATLTEEGIFSNDLADVMLNDQELQSKLIEEIVLTVQEKGYAGVDVDFEFIYPKDRVAYVEFIKNLTDALNSLGLEVFVALAPKTYSEQPGLLYEAHDYAALGAVSDAVLLMTYEWGYTYGPPMAVAPLNNVREVLDYGVTQIPPNKIFMGIPNYGYDWTLPYVRNESRARNISNTEAVEIAVRVGAEIMFDEEAQSPFFEYTDEMGNDHIVWFEDARSIDAKMRLVDEYGLRGAGYWTVMNYFPQNWAVVNSLYDVR